ncbi:MAG: type 2 isopentenyl-diphosphate Delta-isomerase [bacterium]
MNPRQMVTNSIVRQRRKDQHLKLALKLSDGARGSLFGGISFQPEALPELSQQDIDITTEFCGMKFSAPLLINALTGGTRRGACINAQLAQVAKCSGLPMAVGSQRIALDDPRVASSFTIVRRIYPDGVIFANLGADSSADDARGAVEMLQAQGLQLHLNAAQELAMKEGDRSFYWGERIMAVSQQLPVPVIAKEVGCGITGVTARRLLELGVAAIDVSGSGGTNFVLIEHTRRDRSNSPLTGWGLSTARSLLDVLGANPKAEVCASGGIRSGLDMAKALALGAKICGVAKPLLQAVTVGGVKAGVCLVQRYLAELRTVMILVGAKDLPALRRKPLVFDCETWAYLQQLELTDVWTRK